jgi:AraC family transcriptional regulator, transcriptional activator of pobA
LSDASRALYDPRNGDLALRVTDLRAGDLAQPRRTNYFTIYWIQQGGGTFWADAACHRFAERSLLFFVPYQNVRLAPEGEIRGLSLQFHANFLCIETYHHEVGCNGVLFNDIYGIPRVDLDEGQQREIAELVGHIREELGAASLAHAEVLLSYLKILLVRATRLKLEQQEVRRGQVALVLPSAIQKLRELLEANYRTLHSPADYAKRLHMTPKALGRAVKEHLGKTLSELIRERVLKQARWDLLHTLDPVKRIAHGLGFDDELYFSRLFKRATGFSPTSFREFETTIRGGSNLSIPPPLPSIPSEPGSPHNASDAERKP